MSQKIKFVPFYSLPGTTTLYCDYLCSVINGNVTIIDKNHTILYSEIILTHLNNYLQILES